MNLLLDTHIFLWYISRDSRLPSAVLQMIRDPAQTVYLSVVSLWEAIVKHQLGKLPLPQAPETYLPRQRHLHQIASLALDEESVAHLTRLPALHKDPFDRMLICQTMRSGLTLVTVDSAVRAYSAHVSIAP